MIPIYGMLDSKIERWFRQRDSGRFLNLQSIVRSIVDGGDESLHYINLRKYGVDSRETGLYATRHDVEEALSTVGEYVKEALNNLVNKYLSMWKRRMASITQYISPSTGVNISYHPKPYDAVAAVIPSDDIVYVLNISTAAYAAGVRNIYFVSSPTYEGGLPNPSLLVVNDILNYGYILKTDPLYGLLYLMMDKKYRGYFRKYVVPHRVYDKLPPGYRGSSLVGVKPITRICYIFDDTVDHENLILDIYSWIELFRDVRICLVSLSRSTLQSIIEEELSLRKRAVFSIYSKYVDEMVVSIIVSSYNEAIRVVNKLGAEYLNINVERNTMYRLVDYIRNSAIITVGKYSLSPYAKIFSGSPLLVNISNGVKLHTCLDYIDIGSYLRVDPEAIVNDYEQLVTLFEWLNKPINHLFTRHIINQL